MVYIDKLGSPKLPTCTTPAGPPAGESDLVAYVARVFCARCTAVGTGYPPDPARTLRAFGWSKVAPGRWLCGRCATLRGKDTRRHARLMRRSLSRRQRA